MLIEEAKRIYRDAWNSWLLCTDKKNKSILEQIMDAHQPYIAGSPVDPPGVWKEFTETLPGFKDLWNRLKSELKTKQKFVQ